MRGLKYSDVCLLPEFGTCSSRSECSTETVIGGKPFRLPIIPANMKSVISVEQCKWLSHNDYFYIMHRFDIDRRIFISKASEENWPAISISVGVKEADKQLIYWLAAYSNRVRVDFITIDIAHGYCGAMREMIEYIRKYLGKDVCIIAGNVATPDAVVALYAWGADYVKIGIGQGSPCTTKDKTGFTMPMFTCVKKSSDCYASRVDFNHNERIPIIADGGIKCTGDIAKALVAGADLVMAGSIFASCADSPAVNVEIDGVVHKAYFGSASTENKNHNHHIEGKLDKIPTSALTVEQKLLEIKEDLQSSISYAGGTDLTAFKKVRYMEL